MPQERLASERRVVLQEVVDVPHPVVLLPWWYTFAAEVHFAIGPRVVRFGDARTTDAWYGIQ